MRPPVLRVRRPLKSSAPIGCRFSERTQLFGDLVHHFGADDVIDDDASVVGERGADFVGGS